VSCETCDDVIFHQTENSRNDARCLIVCDQKNGGDAVSCETSDDAISQRGNSRNAGSGWIVGEQRKGVADAEHDLSHSSARLGGVTATPEGGIAKDDPNRAAGSYNQTVGSAKEFVGNLVGAEGLKREGIQQNKEGQGQEAEGQLKDLSQGVKDRVGGTVGTAVAGITGNAAQKEDAAKQHDDGKARQRGVESDLQKQAPQ